jgi:hypothetical protein
VAQSFEFPDIEELLTAYLGAALGVPAGTRSSTADTYLRILRTGGPAPTRVTDSPQVTVEAYDPLESGALRLLGSARRELADLPGTELAGWSVKSVTEMGGPANLPDPNSTSKRYTMTAVVQIRGKQPI